MGVNQGVRRGNYNRYKQKQMNEAIQLLKEQKPVIEVSDQTGIKKTALYYYRRQTIFIGNTQNNTIENDIKISGVNATKNRAVYDFLLSETSDVFFTYKRVTAYLRQYTDYFASIIETELNKLGISKAVSIDNFVTDNFSSTVTDKDFCEKLRKDAIKSGEALWFVMFWEKKYKFFPINDKTEDRQSFINKAIVTVTRLLGQETRFMITKPGISARKIIAIIETLKKASPGKKIRIVIMDKRIESFMSLRKNYPDVEIELPFVDNNSYANWLQMDQNRKKLKQIMLRLNACDSIDRLASLTRVPAGVIKLFRDMTTAS